MRSGLLHDGFRRSITQRVKDGELSEAEGAELAQFYESRYDAYTYLAVNGVRPVQGEAAITDF